MSIAEIIERLGGNMAVARFLRIQTGSVRMWKQNGNIPSKHHEQLIALAVKEGLAISRADLNNAGWTTEAAVDR